MRIVFDPPRAAVGAMLERAITRGHLRHATDTWLADLPRPRQAVSHEAALAALDHARSELDQDE